MTRYSVSFLFVVAVLMIGLGAGPFPKQHLAAYGEATQAATEAQGSYASVNGLNMYYEIHGSGEPLVLLHGGLSTIEIDFERILPSLAKTRQIIAIEQQAHGHTADIDRPLTYEQMAEDTTALLHQLKIEKADFFGFSVGAEIAIQIAIRHPELVRKLVLMSVSYNNDGVYPEILAGEAALKPEDLVGSPFQQAYAKVAPYPEQWPTLVAKIKQLSQFKGWSPEAIQSIKAPALLIIGDSDIIRPEHTVQMFHLLGGGVPGDLTGLPNSQLAVLPGTSHISITTRVDWLFSMITAFLDAPISPKK